MRHRAKMIPVEFREIFVLWHKINCSVTPYSMSYWTPSRLQHRIQIFPSQVPTVHLHWDFINRRSSNEIHCPEWHYSGCYCCNGNLAACCNQWLIHADMNFSRQTYVMQLLHKYHVSSGNESKATNPSPPSSHLWNVIKASQLWIWQRISGIPLEQIWVHSKLIKSWFIIALKNIATELKSWAKRIKIWFYLLIYYSWQIAWSYITKLTILHEMGE